MHYHVNYQYMEIIKMKLKILIIALLLLLNISHAYAADLRGKLTGINGAQIKVNCSGSQKSANISKTGSFNVTGLPANKSCYFTVTAAGASSVKMSFNSKNNVTVYNGSLKKLGNKILVIQQ